VPASIEEVKRTNTVVVNPNQQAEFKPRCYPYAMNIDQERNCYSYSSFGHIASKCRKRKES